MPPRDEDFDEPSGPDDRWVADRWTADLTQAAAWLTVLRRDPAGTTPGAMVAAARAFPILGAALGVAAAAAYGIGNGLGFYGLGSAALALALVAALSGARGEVGAAAFVTRQFRDATGEGAAAQAGVFLVVFGIALRLGLVAAVSFAGAAAAMLVAAVTVSRVAMPLAAGWASPGHDGRRLWVVALVAALILILFLGLWGAVVAAVLAVAAAAAPVAAARRVGTELDPPALWAIQQATEIAILVGAVATL